MGAEQSGQERQRAKRIDMQLVEPLDCLPRELLADRICLFLHPLEVVRLCMTKGRLQERLGGDFWTLWLAECSELGRHPPYELTELRRRCLDKDPALDPSLPRFCAVLQSLRVCSFCGLPELTKSRSNCTACGLLVSESFLRTLRKGLALAQRAQFHLLWRVGSQVFGPECLPELHRLELVYSLRDQGSALNTLREETKHRRPTLLSLRVRVQQDDQEGETPHLLGAWIPFEWPWRVNRAEQKGRGSESRSAADETLLAQRLWLFQMTMSALDKPQAVIWPVSTTGLRPRDLMRASKQEGLLVGGTSISCAPLSIDTDLRHGQLLLPNQYFRQGRGEKPESSHVDWQFAIVDMEVWAPPFEESIEDGSLPFDFEYQNLENNKRMLKIAFGGIGTGLMR